jgi:hypothetical protein
MGLNEFVQQFAAQLENLVKSGVKGNLQEVLAN